MSARMREPVAELGVAQTSGATTREVGRISDLPFNHERTPAGAAHTFATQVIRVGLHQEAASESSELR